MTQKELFVTLILEHINQVQAQIMKDVLQLTASYISSFFSKSPPFLGMM
jgi:hypothetical protein